MLGRVVRVVDGDTIVVDGLLNLRDGASVRLDGGDAPPDAASSIDAARAVVGAVKARKDAPVVLTSWVGEATAREARALLRAAGHPAAAVEVDGGHHVHLTHPERVAPLVAEFLVDS